MTPIHSKDRCGAYLPATRRFGLDFTSRYWIGVVIACGLCSVAIARGETADEFARSQQARAQLRLVSPTAAAALARGETLLTDKHPADAATLFTQASELVPSSPIAARFQCEALTMLDQPDAAAKACRRALVNAQTQKDKPRDMLALVRALLAGTNSPTPERLREAIMVTQVLMRQFQNNTAPFIAQCEITRRLNSAGVQGQCDTTIGFLSPASQELTRVRTAMAVYRDPWFVWGAWLALTGLVAVTMIHAFLRPLFRPRHSAAMRLIQMSLLVLAFLAPTEVWAQPIVAPRMSDNPKTKPKDLGSLSVNEQDPERSVPTPQQRDADPVSYAYLVVAISDRAERAFKHEDYKAAVRFYKALVKAVPNRSVSYAKLCRAYEALEDWKSALENCGLALGFDGVTGQDYDEYARLTLEHKPKLQLADIQNLDAVIQHLRSALPESALADIVDCEVGARIHDQQRLLRCTTKLTAIAPSDPKTLTFQWAYAVDRGDYYGAKALLARLKQTPLGPSTIERMEQTTLSARPLWRRVLSNWWSLGVLALFLIALGALRLKWQRRPATARLRAADQGI